MAKLLQILQRLYFCQLTELVAHNISGMFANRPFGDCLVTETCCELNVTRDIRYLLYNQEHSNGLGIQLPVNNVNKLSQIYSTWNIDKTLETIIFVHGFTEGAPGDSGITIRDAYLKSGKYNIILVDWRNLVAAPWYVTATRNTKPLGKYIAILINELEKIGVPIEKIHLIGFSLGAEAAGFTGKQLRDANGNPKLHHLTGLDPAWPLFPLNNRPHEILERTDAKFVDVIHTDAGIFGYPFNMGHIDFYPNSGRHYQPGCHPRFYDTQDYRMVGLFAICSHVRAWKYYAESVLNPYGFKAVKCIPNYLNDDKSNLRCDNQDIAYMGFAVNRSARGSYYLKTNPFSPYSLSSNKTIEKRILDYYT